MASTCVRVALAVGDPNGIGPEISLKAAAAYAGRPDLRISMFGPQNVIDQTAQSLGLQHVLPLVQVCPTGDLAAAAFRPGQISGEAGALTVAAATAAICSVQRGESDVVVAAPHHETAVHRADIPFAGYPPLLAKVTGDEVFSLLIGGGMRIIHATLHEGLLTAVARLTPELIVSCVKAGHRAVARLGVESPRIAILGINPHAGEGGLFGSEDERITKPAAAQLGSLGFRVDGPFGADILLPQRAHDLYVAMYHDQGHVPIKLLSPRGASAIAVGADVTLCTVGHGSAMDIAGRGVADAGPLVSAIALAANVRHPQELSSCR